MPWVRIDDGFARHPKIAEAGPLALAMQVAALCYCNRELTDGFVPRSVARTLLDFQYVDPDNKVWTIDRSCGMHGETITAEAVIEMLVWVGMWEQVEGGYKIHDYTDYQPTKADVLRERENGAKRQKDWRNRHRNAVTTTVTNDISNGPVTDAPYPVPVPEPIKEKEKKPSVSKRKPTVLSADWVPSEYMLTYARDKGMTEAQIRNAADNIRDWSLSKNEARADWDAAWRGWVRRDLERPSVNGTHRSNGRLTPEYFANMAREMEQQGA